MKQGIEREEFLGMLTEMAHCLEETDMNLLESLQGVREKMYNVHSLQLEKTSRLLDKVEREIPQALNSSVQTINEQASLKLEMSF
ncbi:hypothetical protein J7E38_01995 [Bacillus sp. ISL-35]|uniref:hypothetical protein n=1 Tax=Bacillus sp. ISL-35 TaxID=2819122 RepID=UPI001BE6842F|nr:hypothetical protein [Bacillus sp. ISL-35]MBT2677753.1 hypothetical protein [Bacillus sp. ISL-35]MBT2704534.1 hypothetical protein [Chryseobacterium sp. ISL-80]